MTEALHTVVVSLPCSSARVVVERLLGTPDQACESAKEVLLDFLRDEPRQWATEVLRTEEITDVPDPTETN